MFASIRQLVALYDDVPEPEEFAEHHEPVYSNYTKGCAVEGLGFRFRFRFQVLGFRV
jgi:hypothetical protein